MINTYEMRIGNMVCYPKYWKGEDKIFHIRDIFFEGDYVGLTDFIIQTKVMTKFLKPIPLTEEWLLKFGGQIKPFSIGIILDRFRFIWKEEYKYWYVIAADPGGAYMTKIEFVHELQNFFQSTNGQELTLKP